MGQPGNFELKSNDQIRIVFSHLKDNYYLLKGVFLKKETWGQNDFITTCTRPEPKNGYFLLRKPSRRIT